MKKIKQAFSLFLLIALISSILVGCSSDEMALLNALTKSSDITSMESKTEMTLNLSAQGLSVADQQSFNQVAMLLNDSKVVVDQKMSSNTDKTISKSQVDASVNIGGMGISTSVWVDLDLTGKTPKIKEILKVPSILAVSLPSKYQGKSYMVMDVDQIMKTTPTSNFNTQNLLEFSKDLTPKAVDFLKEYALQFDPGFTFITRKEDKTVGDQKLSVYSLKLDDTSFKDLLNYTVNNFAKNEKALGFVKDLLITCTDMISTSNTEKLKAKQEINKSFDEIKNGLPAFLDQWDKTMSILKDVRILGDKGINIDFAVNSDGYVVSESGTIDLLIDIKAYADAGEKLSVLDNSSYIKKSTNQKGIIKISVDFSNTITNINKDVVINIPVVNAQNSFSFTDLINSFAAPVVKKDTTPPGAPTVNKTLRT